MSVITLTFGDCAENHVGMQQIGTIHDNGFTYDDLIDITKIFKNKEYKIYDLHTNEQPEAYLLVIKNAISNPDKLYNEMKNLNWDKKAFMKGRVVNKHARYNLCFDNYEQEPDYENGKGRIVNINDTTYLNKLYKKISKNDNCNNLKIEGNYYFDVNKCGIGYHGDTERRKVIGVRLGNSMPLVYQWYLRGEPVGDKIIIKLSHGDLYVMSEKAVGFDWKKRIIYTLRHSTGCKKYTNI